MLMKIGEITNKFGISHRSLHYWEDMGIIKSSRAENDYRHYDEENQQKIRQILVLRKLRLPLKQIIMVLESNNTVEIIDTLQKNLNEVGNEIDALSTIRSILDSFITKLNENMMIDVKVNLFDDSTILEIADSLIVTRPVLKEEKTVEDFVKADERLSKLADKDIRIIYLIPTTVASAIGVGDNAEHEADVIMGKFKDEVLSKMNPATRFFGFNDPEFTPDGKFMRHKYEVWATIPTDLEVPSPLTKKHFDGGLYIAYTSKPVNFEGWRHFREWLKSNEDFEYDINRSYRNDTFEELHPKSGSHIPDRSGWGCLEEHFNSYNIYGLKDRKHTLTHIDFLIPIKEKEVE